MLKGVLGGFCALSEPSVRFRIDGLRFLFQLTLKRSLVRAQSRLKLKTNLVSPVKDGWHRFQVHINSPLGAAIGGNPGDSPSDSVRRVDIEEAAD